MTMARKTHIQNKKKSLRKSHTDVLTGSCEKETRAFATKLKSNCKRRSHDKKREKTPEGLQPLWRKENPILISDPGV